MFDDWHTLILLLPIAVFARQMVQRSRTRRRVLEQVERDKGRRTAL